MFSTGCSFFLSNLKSLILLAKVSNLFLFVNI
jgi:hypothetical protein